MLEAQQTKRAITELVQHAESECSLLGREKQRLEREKEQVDVRIARWERVLELQLEAFELIGGEVQEYTENDSASESDESDISVEDRMIQLIEEGPVDFSARHLIDQIADEGLSPDMVTTEKQVYAVLAKLVWDGVIRKGRNGTYGKVPSYASSPTSDSAVNGH